MTQGDGPDGTGRSSGAWHYLEHSGEVLVSVHDPQRCAGRSCTIHNRSEHGMRDLPQHWREDRGIMERVCAHGVGHPDPDNPWNHGDPRWLHGCDGCCGEQARSGESPQGATEQQTSERTQEDGGEAR